GGYAECDARNADQRTDAMAAEVRQNQLQKDHDARTNLVSSLASERLAISLLNCTRTSRRNDKPAHRRVKRAITRSPRPMRRSMRSNASDSPMVRAILGRPR